MIEIGKQYEIINSWHGNNGKIVTVTAYGGKQLDGCSTSTGDRWYIDREMETNVGNKINHMGEKQLRPIYDGNEKISWEQMEDIWTPEVVSA